MPSLEINTINEILNICSDNINNYQSFLETGTHYGDTIIPMSEHFKYLYTIELSENIYKEFNKKNFDRNKINSLLGDSSKLLPNILEKINTNTIFFLDGHYSSGGTAKGDKDVPLIEEISAINIFFKNSGIIIIDDLRLFGTLFNENWSEITKEILIKQINNRVIKSFDYGDRFIILFK